MRHISSVILIAAVYGCGNEGQVTRPAEPPAQLASTTRYEIVKLASLGGTQSRGMAINDHGWVAGWSNLPDGSRRAALWKDGSITPTGTLGGPSSAVPWIGLNNAGMVVGVSHTDEEDPLDEDWACELVGFLPETTDLICRGFVWENEVMRELPTLGGNHGFATGVNNSGEVVGWAETPVHDRTLSPAAAQVLRFRAVICLYGVMNFVVLPLSAAVTGPKTLPVVINGLLIHALGVGLPSAVFARVARRTPKPLPLTP